MCHTSAPDLNPYSAAYLNAGRSSAAFDAIENLDPDGDGYTNIQEINDFFFPGNAPDHPVAAPTATDLPSTATVVPPTATAVPSAATGVPPTVTSVPSTSTSGPPTATQVSPTNTPVIPPTATQVVQPTATAVIQSTQTPEPTLENSPTPKATLQCRDDDDDDDKDHSQGPSFISPLDSLITSLIRALGF